MSLKIAAALVAAILVPGTARAFGIPGCTNLPEYNRALGALQGMTSACDMSVAEARRIVAAHDGVPAIAEPQTVPTPPMLRRHPRARRAGKSARDRRPSAR